jgi:sarcosine oxidase, subunit delta
MKLLRCPVNGLRPIQEFHYGGEVRSAPDPNACSNAEWTDYVFNRSGEHGIAFEWWYHVPSSTWFVAERDTLKDEFVRTYTYEEFRSRG